MRRLVSLYESTWVHSERLRNSYSSVDAFVHLSTLDIRWIYGICVSELRGCLCLICINMRMCSVEALYVLV